MKTKEEMLAMRALAAQKYAESLEWQKVNTHELEGGYVAMPTIQRNGIGWELHPPKGESAGVATVHTGPVWYVKDLEEARRKAVKHQRFYMGDGEFVEV